MLFRLVILAGLINYSLVAWAIVRILRRPREPRAMMAWSLALLLLPVLGLVLFGLIGQPRMERTLRRRRRRRQKLALSLSKRVAALEELHAIRRIERMETDVANLMRVATRVGLNPPTHSNHVTIYHDEEKSIVTLKEAIQSARSHVHLEYYIFKSDETGRLVGETLEAKAREGVEVRVLVDYVGSWSMSRRCIRSMRRAGVQFAYFMPVAPWQGRWRINFRNHRKLLVVDGIYGFTGSHNIGNEYRGRHPTLGPWQDTNLSIIGPAVQQFQEVFVEDWHFSTGIELVSDHYFPTPVPVGEHIVQVVASGPDSEINAVHDVLFAAIAAACRNVSIITPYFVPDAAMLHALQAAAYRGVAVRLLIPSRNDLKLALWAGRSFYPQLTRAGVEVYEYDHGMLHNKVVVVDEVWSMLGSANLDDRSFRINFEICTILYDRALAHELLRDFETFWAGARRVGQNGSEQWTFGESLALGAARMLSPLL